MEVGTMFRKTCGYIRLLRGVFFTVFASVIFCAPTFTEPLCFKELRTLSPSIQKSLKTKKTRHEVTLDKILRSGTENPGSSIGCYAGDIESYTVFAPMFDKVIKSVHNVPPGYKYTQDLNMSNLPSFNKDVVSVRIRLARNIAKHPFESTMTRKDRLKLEKEVLEVVKDVFAGTEFEGSYYSLPQLSEAEKKDLVSKHLLFKEGDKCQESAGIASDWPVGRGSYVSNDRKFQLWINEEDHLRVMYLQKGGDLKHVAKKVFKALGLLNAKLKFAYSNRYGYLNSCPTNIGSAMRASIHIKVPNMSEKELIPLCKQRGLSVRGTGGEDTAVLNNTFDISYKRRLGESEKEILTNFINAVNSLKLYPPKRSSL